MPPLHAVKKPIQFIEIPYKHRVKYRLTQISDMHNYCAHAYFLSHSIEERRANEASPALGVPSV